MEIFSHLNSFPTVQLFVLWIKSEFYSQEDMQNQILNKTTPLPCQLVHTQKFRIESIGDITFSY